MKHKCDRLVESYFSKMSQIPAIFFCQVDENMKVAQKRDAVRQGMFYFRKDICKGITSSNLTNIAVDVQHMPCPLTIFFPFPLSHVKVEMLFWMDVALHRMGHAAMQKSTP